jgi:lysozyme family protein
VACAGTSVRIAVMYIPTTFDEGTDWARHGNTITGKGGALAEFRGIQADLNYFADKVGFEAVKVDGALGPRTLAAVQAVAGAVAKADPALKDPGGHGSVDDVAKNAVAIRGWLETTARQALGLGDLRRYHRGQGKEWNVKDTIAYGAGPVHEEFKGLQGDLNGFAGALGFAPLGVDGFIGAQTAAAVKQVYDAVVKKKPLAAMTPFPVPDTKEEAAEFAMFIRKWLKDVATKALLAEAGA